MIIGEAITAKPNPRTPWTEELIKSNIAKSNMQKNSRIALGLDSNAQY